MSSKIPVRNLKQWIANIKKLFKLNKTNNTHRNRKIIDYFGKEQEITDNKITGKIQKAKKHRLQNNSLPYNMIEKIIQKNAVENHIGRK